MSVKLNVGGTSFETAAENLSRFANSFFFKVIDPENELQTMSKDGTIFIDRSAKNFKMILNYLRDGDPAAACPGDPGLCLSMLADARYYGLPALEKFLCARLTCIGKSFPTHDDPTNQQVVLKSSTSPRPFCRAVFSSDGTAVIALSQTGFGVWDIAHGSEMKEKGIVGPPSPLRDAYQISMFVIDYDTKLVLCEGGCAEFWNLKESTLIERRIVESNATGTCVSPDGTLLAIFSTSFSIPSIKIYESKLGNIKEFFQLTGIKDRASGSSFLKFSQDSGLILAVWDNKVYVCDIAMNKLAFLFSAQKKQGNEILGCGFAGSRSTFFLVFRNTISFFHTDSGTLLGSVQQPEGVVNYGGGDTSPDGRFFSVLCVFADGAYGVRVVDAELRADCEALRGHMDRVNSCAFSADSTKLLTTSDDCRMIVWLRS